MDRIGTFQIGEVMTTVQARLKDYTEQHIPRELWTDIINAIVLELYDLGGIKGRADYKDRVELTDLTAGHGGYGLANEAVTYTNSTKTLYFPTSKFGDGSFTTGITNFNTGANANFLNAEVIIREAAGLAIMFKTTIASITDGNNVVLTDAYGSDLAANEFVLVTIHMPDTADVIDIGALSVYKVLDDITAIYDSTNGECLEFTEKEFRGIADPVYANPQYKNKVIYYRDGEYLRFAKGASVSAYGTRTMYYNRHPQVCSALTDLVDIKDTEIKLVYDLAMLAGLHTLKVPIPSDLKSAEAKLQVMKRNRDEELRAMLTDKPS
jgi:hypothetical protein